jgi:transcriptional regulator with XRE-family HTH domain
MIEFSSPISRFNALTALAVASTAAIAAATTRLLRRDERNGHESARHATGNDCDGADTPPLCQRAGSPPLNACGYGKVDSADVADMIAVLRGYGLTVEQIARIVGVRPPSVSRWHTGERWPTPQRSARVSRLYDAVCVLGHLRSPASVRKLIRECAESVDQANSDQPSQSQTAPSAVQWRQQRSASPMQSPESVRGTILDHLLAFGRPSATSILATVCDLPSTSKRSLNGQLR